MLITPRHRTQVDVVVQQFGTVAALFDTALLNEASVTDDLEPGSSWALPAMAYEAAAVVVPRIAPPLRPLTVPVRTTLADMAQSAHGSISALFRLALLNGVSITDDIVPGTQLQADTEQETLAQVIIPALPEAPEAVVLKKHQSLADWTTQHFGTVASLFDAALLNGLSVTDEPQPGTALQRTIADAVVVNYFRQKELDVVSYKTAAEIKPGGIGYMQIGNDFIVS